VNGVSRWRLAPAPAWVSAGLSLALAGGLYAASVALGYSGALGGADEVVSRHTAGFMAAVAGGVGLTLLAGALLVGLAAPVGWGIGALLAGWVATLAGAGPEIQVDFVIAGAGHLVAAELAYWSVGARRRSRPVAGRATALWALELLGALALAAGLGWLLVIVLAGFPGGTAVDLLAVAAVLGFGVAVLHLARDSRQ
jgi:hypothetical protein